MSRPWLTITAPCPVCKERFELTQPMADHMSDHEVKEIEAAGIKVIIEEGIEMTTIRERYMAHGIGHIPDLQHRDIGTLIDIIDELVLRRRPYKCLGWDEAVKRVEELVGRNESVKYDFIYPIRPSPRPDGEIILDGEVITDNEASL